MQRMDIWRGFPSLTLQHLRPACPLPCTTQQVFQLSDAGKLEVVLKLPGFAICFHPTIPSRGMRFDKASSSIVEFAISNTAAAAEKEKAGAAQEYNSESEEEEMEVVMMGGNVGVLRPKKKEEKPTGFEEEILERVSVNAPGVGNDLAWSADARRCVMTTEQAAGVVIADWENKQTLHVIDLGMQALRWRPVISRDGSLCAVASPKAGPAVTVYECDSGKVMWQAKAGSDAFMTSFSPNNRMLAVPLTDQSLRLVSLETFKTVACLTMHVDRVMCVAWHPSKPLLVSGGADSQVHFTSVPGSA